MMCFSFFMQCAFLFYQQTHIFHFENGFQKGFLRNITVMLPLQFFSLRISLFPFLNFCGIIFPLYLILKSGENSTTIRVSKKIWKPTIYIYIFHSNLESKSSLIWLAFTEIEKNPGFSYFHYLFFQNTWKSILFFSIFFQNFETLIFISFWFCGNPDQ